MKGLFNKKKPTKGSDIGQKLIDKNDTTVELQKPQFRRDVQRENKRSPTYASPPVVISSTNSPIPAQSSIPSKPSISENEHEDKNEPVVEGYTWDFCILVPNPDFVGDGKEDEKKDENTENRIPVGEILERLHLGGLQTYQFYSGDNDEIFIKVRAPLQRLMSHAEETGFRLLLDEHYLEKHVDDPLNPIADDPDITRLSPYEYIYGKYVQDKPGLYAKAHGLTHPFSSIVRIKLIMDIIQSNDENCCALNLRKLAKDGSGSIISYFPLHNDEIREELKRSWFSFRVSPWEQPIDDVKEYLGEKVALYFEFVGHYTTWLLPLSIAGGLVTIDLVVETSIYDGNLDKALLGGYTIPFYCIFVSFWAQLMIEYWKRKQNTRAMEWGTTLFEEEETDRPEFKGELIRSIINGKKMRYFAPAEKARKVLWSYFVISLMMLLVIACVSAIFGLQYYINYKMTGSASLQSTGNTGVSILAAVQIIILNMVYSDMAINLTNEENHRTDTDYDDALIGKLFAFSFVNSYASLFFVAFIKHNMGETCNGPCMVELAYQLFVIFASKVTLDKVSTIMTLYVNKWLKERAEQAEYTAAIARGETVETPSKVEIESRLEDYDPSLGTLEDYGQVFIQYGYVTLFVAACPLAPLLAYVSNCIEFRSDGYKLLYFSKRVMPTGAEDIGTWLSILQMTSIAAVITNAGILCYTMDIITFSGVGTVWLFIGFQYSIFVAMAIFAYIVDDCPEYVTLQLQRQDHLADRAEKSEEELAEESAKEKRGNTRLAVVPQVEIHRRDLTE